jgi:hypothetical protein
MKDQTFAAAGSSDLLEEFARAICRVRGWGRATVERFAEDGVRVTNPSARLWVECRYRGDGRFGSMSVGRIGEGAYFQPEFVLPNPDFVTMRARQFVQGVRKRERRAKLRRLSVRNWLWDFRLRRDIARRREAAPPAGA